MKVSQLEHDRARAEMVRDQIRRRGDDDPRVLAAMQAVPRHEFVDAAQRHLACEDYPLPIGHGQTVSQPFIVAYMTERLNVRPGDRILEIGSGCGYQTAVLLEMGATVFSVEIVEGLFTRAEDTLSRMGYARDARLGDGREGWAEEAPFDGIIAAAAPEEIPPKLIAQLAEGARLVIPVGGTIQDLKTLEKRGDALTLLDTLPVRFVPLV